MTLRSCISLSLTALSLVALAACNSKPVGQDKANELEKQGEQQVEKIEQKTDAAEKSVQQSEQRVKDAEKQLEGQ